MNKVWVLIIIANQLLIGINGPYKSKSNCEKEIHRSLEMNKNNAEKVYVSCQEWLTLKEGK